MTPNISQIQEKITPILKENHVNYAALFGSYARNEASDASDVDVLVRFSQPISLVKLCGIERNLSEILNKKVDLVTTQALSPHIKPYIEQDLYTLYGKE